MGFFGVLKLAFISLSRNKMRSSLTALGIIIGVASVVGMVALGQGAYYSVQENISKMGTNLIMVMPGSSNRRGFHGARGSMTTLKPSDAEAILRDCPSVGMVSPICRGSGQAIFGNNNSNTGCIGVTEDYLKISSREIEDGRFFTIADISAGAKVCVVGTTVVENLFGNINPIGQTIRYAKMPVQIIGVLKSRGETGMGGGDQDDLILMPFSVVQRRICGINYAHMLSISAATADSVEAAKAEIEEVLRRRHKLVEGKENDFRIATQDDIAEMAGSTLTIIALLLGAIASVSLVVGGIGVMNIMLVSVTERTREIGIRMAIGAKTSDILWQFLIESVVLTSAGGILGIIGGVGLAYTISKFTAFPPVVSTASIIISVAFSAVIGIFFGLYPAYKASQLDPIEAFRYE